MGVAIAERMSGCTSVGPGMNNFLCGIQYLFLKGKSLHNNTENEKRVKQDIVKKFSRAHASHLPGNPGR